MNQTGGKAPSTPRLSEYATNALEKIRKELRMFSIGDVHNITNSTNGQTHTTSHNAVIQNQVECDLNALLTHLMTTGYTEEQALAFIKSNGRSELAGIVFFRFVFCLLFGFRIFFCLFCFVVRIVPIFETNLNESHAKFALILYFPVVFVVSPQSPVPPQQLPPKLFRKPSIEREIPQYQRGSGMMHVFLFNLFDMPFNVSCLLFFLLLLYRFRRRQLKIKFNNRFSNNLRSWIL